MQRSTTFRDDQCFVVFYSGSGAASAIACRQSGARAVPTRQVLHGIRAYVVARHMGSLQLSTFD